MPSFTLTTHSAAPVEDVWKLLHDPSCYPRWWDGIETVEVREISADRAAYTMWPQGYPDFPMDQVVTNEPTRVTVSCLVSDLIFTWQLAEVGAGTSISVRVELPDREAHRLETQQVLIERSLVRLAALAAR